MLKGWQRYANTEDKVRMTLEASRKTVDSAIEGSPHWMWTGSTFTNGYGQIGVKGKMVKVHRAAYIVYNNLKFSDANIDNILHKPFCSIRSCFNPEHLYNGTHENNMQDKLLSGTNHNHNKTHCPAGHEYTLGNTYIINGTNRKCRKCILERMAKRYRELKEKKSKQEEGRSQNEQSSEGTKQ
jgi:hypothetical protein